jgi:nitrite reductase/ring-hydroxylating ferredoxin subunit
VTWQDAGAVAELEAEGRVLARLGGREVGVVRAPDGAVHGVRNRCPHHGGPLCLGTVRERLDGEPGRYQSTGRLVLRCPWHGWQFDLENGRCLDDPNLRAAVYPARIEGGRVLIDV